MKQISMGLFVWILCGVVSGVRADNVSERATLLKGITAISAPGALPGAVVAYGKSAFVVVAAQRNRSRVPLFAAARYGKGRVVIGGHEGFLRNREFMVNVARWVSGEKANKTRLTVMTLEQTGAAFSGDNFAPLRAQPDSLANSLPNADVLYLNQSTLDGKPNAIRAVQTWVKNGGGLIVCGPAWGWQMLHPQKSLTDDHSGNLLVRPMGLAWSAETVEPTGKNGDYVTPQEALDTLHSRVALDELAKLADNKEAQAKEALAQAGEIVALTVAALPPDEQNYAQEADKLCARHATVLIPTREKPLTNAEPLARLKCVMDVAKYRRLPPEQIKANPASASFPGSVPQDAKRIRQTVTIDTAIKGWHSTGLYAAPGEVITIATAEEKSVSGLGVRIGAHSDTLWHLAKWERFPEITLEKPLGKDTLSMASPFGGAIFITVPDNAPTRTLTVTIGNAVAAPLYVRGKTDLTAWRQTIRNAPAPWAELVGNRVALTVPSEVVRNLEDPDALMTYWDEVMDHCADLYAIPHERSHPERYCVDRQISAGYMHSGYPIMTGDDVAATFTTLSKLRGKNAPVWGFYHEVGHNHQREDWTWDGCGEVTNNLFSLYGYETLNDSDYQKGHPAVAPDAMQKRLKTYVVQGSPYERWKNDPFLALTMYIQLQKAFGWDAFKKVFAEYRQLSSSERPRSDQARRDQWMVRFSKTVGKNLAPFFVAWGVPTTESANLQIADLPAWMPPDFPTR